ncbi:MAG: response regulator transcription factor [Chitinophagales bacterium]
MAKASVLLVEDETKVSTFIKKGLEEYDYDVKQAFDGMEAKRMVRAGSYDLMIIDIKIPVMNGYEVCRYVRETDTHVPILMLTALSSTDDKLEGFDSGADDYLVKPFEFRELLARIKALLKRAQPMISEEVIFKVSDLTLNIHSKEVKRGERKVALTAKEFSLLEYLMRNKGRVISRAELAEKIWDITFDTGTNVIDVYINFLRKKVDKDFPRKLIHTYIGMGYTIKEQEE